MINVYKNIDDFKLDYPNLDLLQNALTADDGDYNLLVATTTIPPSLEKVFANHKRLAPNDDTLSFLRRNKNASMEVLEPFLKDDIDSYEKSVGIEMLKLMGKMGNVNLVFYEVPFPYIKYLVEVLKLSLPDTKLCYEISNNTVEGSALAKSTSTLAQSTPALAQSTSTLAQEDLDEEDIYIEQEC